MKEVKFSPLTFGYPMKAFATAAVNLELAQRRAAGQILAVGDTRVRAVKVHNYICFYLGDMPTSANALGNVEIFSLFTMKKSRPSHYFFEAFFVTPKGMLRDIDLSCTFPPK